MLLGITFKELLTILLPIIGGAVVWLWQSYSTWKNDRANETSARKSSDLAAEEHRDALTFELLQAARTEVAQMREEISLLRPLQRYVIHLEQALTHIQNIIEAPTPEMRKLAEDSARMFLERIRNDTKNTLGK